MFYLGGVGLALFLTLLLLSKREKIGADNLLTIWLLIITIHLLLFYFVQAGLYPQLLGAGIPLPLLHGPLLYLYTLSLTGRQKSLWISLLHFIPAVAVLAYVTPFVLLPVEQKIYVFEHQGAGYEVFNQVNTIATALSGVTYVLLSSLVLRKHRLSIVQEFSSTERINLAWLQYLIYWIGAIWVFVIIGNDQLIYAAAVLFVIFIGFFGIRQVGIFHPAQGISDRAEPPIKESPPEPLEAGTEKRKYVKSGLTAEMADKLHRELVHLMEQEKPFRETELSLAQLAARLNTQSNYLSQVINECEGKNFYDYINTLRIDEFTRLATTHDSRKYTLLGLAQECGFSSKSSFHRYFKKVKGMSPSEFMETTLVSEN